MRICNESPSDRFGYECTCRIDFQEVLNLMVDKDTIRRCIFGSNFCVGRLEVCLGNNVNWDTDIALRAVFHNGKFYWNKFTKLFICYLFFSCLLAKKVIKVIFVSLITCYFSKSLYVYWSMGIPWAWLTGWWIKKNSFCNVDSHYSYADSVCIRKVIKFFNEWVDHSF